MIIDVPDEVVQRIYDIAHTGEELPVGIQAILVRLITEKERKMTSKELTDKIINSINDNYQIELGRPLHLYEIRELIEGRLNENEKGANNEQVNVSR